ncbi:MAG TPA: hypothetical protein VMD59_14120 [Acidimicrobiales bacterium]|nr:hypothetical protein [Acidimicrobiales bacterium]
MGRLGWPAAAGAGVAAAVVAGLLLGGCSSGSVAQWAKASSLGDNDAILVSDAAHLRTGTRLHELEGVKTACQALVEDASTADGQLPTPDETLTDELNNAYEDDYNAGVVCYGTSSFTSAKFRKFERLLAAGSSELATAERLANKLAPGANEATGGTGGSGDT